MQIQNTNAHNIATASLRRSVRFAWLIAVIGGIQQAIASVIVVPTANAQFEGISNLIWLLQGIPTRIQTVIGKSELADIPSGSLITGLSWRRDARFFGSEPWPSSTLTCASYQITLSTSLHPPRSLSLVFNENIGADDVMVFDEALTILPSSFPIGATPNAFGLRITFSTPFLYDAGDLLIDILHSGSGDPGVFMQFDAVDRPATLQTLVQWPGSVLNPGPAVVGYDFLAAPVFQVTYQLVPPTIISQPANRTNVVGTTATFMVTAAGSKPFTYQWLKEGAILVDGGTISGAGTPMLTLADVQPSDAGNYSVIVVNDAGSTISSVAVLTIDADGDGVVDDLDQCPGTARGAAVDEHGCSLEQLVPCEGPRPGVRWENHGQYVLAVTRLVRHLLADRVISESEARRSVKAAVQSNCGKR